MAFCSSTETRIGEASVVVRNTFIHVGASPDAAVVGSSRRCSSMPACGRREGEPSLHGSFIGEQPKLCDDGDSDASSTEGGSKSTETMGSSKDFETISNSSGALTFTPPLSPEFTSEHPWFQPSEMPELPPVLSQWSTFAEPSKSTVRLKATARPYQPSSQFAEQPLNPWHAPLHTGAGPLLTMPLLASQWRVPPVDEVPAVAAGMAPTAAEPSVNLVATMFMEVVSHAIAAMTTYKREHPYLVSAQTSQDHAGWSINLTIHGVDPEQHQERISPEQKVMSHGKAAMLRAASESSSIYVMGYRKVNPFEDTCDGFKANLGLMHDESRMCYAAYCDGACNLGASCRWQHPRCVKRVTVTCTRG